MKLCGYARVSTKDQDYSSQIEQIKKWASAYDHEVTFFKEKVSALDKRPQFELMSKKLDDFDGIVVCALDRLGRSTAELCRYMNDLEKNGKKLIILNVGMNIDTSSSMGKAFLQFMSVLSELERNIIFERMMAGKIRAKKRGVKFGRKRIEIPSDAIKDYLEGGSYAKLKKDYNISKTTLVRGFKELDILRRDQK